MNHDKILKQIAKNSKISLPKTKIAVTALSAGINACLEQRLFYLEISPDLPDDTHETYTTEFMLDGRRAVVKASTIGHYEISIIVALPNDKCGDPFYLLNPPYRLHKGYDLICTGWLERKKGKFIQGVVQCYARRSPWISALADLRMPPAGYEISTKFFR